MTDGSVPSSSLWPSLHSLSYVHACPSLGSPGWHAEPTCASTGLSREEKAPPFTCQQCSNTAQDATRTYCWLMVNFLSTRTLRTFSVNPLSRHLAPVCTAAWVYSSPSAGSCTSLVELHEVPVDSLL